MFSWMSYGMVICYSFNSTDDNSLSVIWNTVNLPLNVFKKDADNSMSCFKNNCMLAKLETFQFIFIKI